MDLSNNRYSSQYRMDNAVWNLQKIRQIKSVEELKDAVKWFAKLMNEGKLTYGEESAISGTIREVAGKLGVSVSDLNKMI